jgi:hypothetical protein
MCVIGLTAIGQQKGAPSEVNPRMQLERCKADMPMVLKNYNNAKYAVFRAQTAGDAASILGPVREAAAALEAMEEPLKACNEAFQNLSAEQRQNTKK